MTLIQVQIFTNFNNCYLYDLVLWGGLMCVNLLNIDHFYISVIIDRVKFLTVI